VSELANRVERVLAATAGDIVSPTVAGLMAAAALTTGDAALAVWALPAGAFAGALTAEGATLVRRAWSDRGDRVRRFAEAAAKEAGIPVDAVPTLAADETVRQLLGVTVQAASEAHGEWKLQMLAKAFVRGAEDPAKVDEIVLLVDVLKDVEVADVRMLAAIHRQTILATPEPRSQATTRAIVREDPGLDGVALPIGRRLHRFDLIRDPGEGPTWSLTLLGTYCVGRLQRLGAVPDADRG
jgi:hypothetical protein